MTKPIEVTFTNGIAEIKSGRHRGWMVAVDTTAKELLNGHVTRSTMSDAIALSAGYLALRDEQKGNISEEEQIRRGENLAAVLGLKWKSNGRVDTSWGDKTALGLYLSVQRIMNGEKP